MCVILYTTINGKNILFKNRDRAYKPKVELIHEIRNGVEVVYIHDIYTNWIEGMNEFGIGIVNSTLNLSDDKKKQKKHKYKMVKGEKVLRILQNKDIHKILNILNTQETDFLEGHTMICSPEDCYHIETTNRNNKANKRNIHSKNLSKTIVYANTGVYYKKEGYVSGEKGFSSFMRKKLIEEEMKRHHLTDPLQLFNIFNKNYENVDPRCHPYRDRKETGRFLYGNANTKERIVSTTSQIMVDMTDKEFYFYYDINNSEFLGIKNKLPKNYNPIIRIFIKGTSKHTTKERMPISRQAFRKIYNKFAKSFKEMQSFNFYTRKGNKKRGHGRTRKK